uniref:Uncharacterized protein n=1 Tax=Solanum lycopersicum TaxID=4081 RepID=A0A3Q7FJY7_SOLLC
MFNEFKKYYVWAPEHDEELKRTKSLKLPNCFLAQLVSIGKMARASEKGGSLHTGGARAISLEKELGRSVAVEDRHREEERKREEEIAVAKDAENKRYATLQAQLTFLFELGNILPPYPASSDGSENDENDKSDKESEDDEE